ncbi:hypothetical protein GCM10025869_14900 [Homoserinibacter gongjuensis]|uniref:Acyl-CoA dehydrogenase/oxidase N-terminal domain-containing protein n=1 Tax=Homoserinibacter gongjuensis TaxID=1162968 RepID=A0ABQ6JTY7_9MICO|nr:hypothetical protein GCM10025869_14900 [Homoserinibacter gongjuensis]
MLATADADHWFSVLTAAGVPAAPLNDIAGGVQFAARLGLDPVTTVGPDAQPTVRHPVRYSRTPPSYRLAPPRSASTAPPFAHGSPPPLPERTPMSDLRPTETLFPLLDRVPTADAEWALRARRVVDEHVRATIDDDAELARFRHETVAAFAEAGLLGLHISGYGCAGASPLAYGLVCQEVEAVDSGWRTLLSVQGSSPWARSPSSAPSSTSRSCCPAWPVARSSDASASRSLPAAATRRR